MGERQFKLAALTDTRAQKLWRKYDSDNSGALDREEFRLLLADLQEEEMGYREISDETVRSITQSINPASSSSISFEEFKSFLQDRALEKLRLMDGKTIIGRFDLSS